MAVFFRDPTYPEDEDRHASFEKELQSSLSAFIPEAVLIEVDAGPSASIPGWLVSIGAASWFIFSAPNTIAENLPIWKGIFQKVLDVAERHGVDISIDVHDAAALTISHVREELNVELGGIQIIDIHRHSENLNGTWVHNCEVAGLKEPRTNFDMHTAACEQLSCRYVFLICADGRAITVLVSSKGRVEFARTL